MTAREILRQAFLPAAAEPWPTGERLRWIFLGRLWMLPITILGNIWIWMTLRDDPAARGGVPDLFLLVNDGLLGLDLLLTVIFLRRPNRFYGAVTLIGAAIEVGTAVVWIQMTGTVTSYFIGTVIILAFLYRSISNYWVGLVCCFIGLGGVLGAYLLEEAGVLPRSSLFAGDLGSNLLPEAYRRTALISILMSYAICFVGTNLLARAIERGRNELARTRAELAKVVDEARMGRLSASRLGRYQLGELLGRGGMGEVYEARRDDGAVVAIKILHAHLGAETAARMRFRREADLVQRLPVECSARVLERGTTEDDVDYIVMERLRGEDLGALFRRRAGALDAAEVVTLAQAIATPLAIAHRTGIVHRDLKPSNVFLEDGALDRVRLLDFGIARLYEGEGGTTVTETTVILGSPGYLPPEQAVGDRDRVGPAADTFALGAILYRAITGQPAFPGRNAVQAIHESLHHVPMPPSSLVPGLPAGVDRVLSVALAKAPEHRYPVATDLAADLARAYTGDPFPAVEDATASMVGSTRGL